MTNPLDEVRVVEVANFIAGPYAGKLLADLGADVVKVEDPRSGDPSRAWSKGLYSPWFIAYNCNKRSLTLNLKTAVAKDILSRLIATADVLIENFRPGVADRLGIGYQRVRELKPQIIYCSISGMGQTGPYARRPSYDTVGQGLSGMLSLLLDPNDPRPIGPAFSDSLTGIFAAYGILAALHARERTGEGQRVETSMLEAAMGLLVEPFSVYFRTGEIADPFTRTRVAQVYAFRCRDDLALAVHLSSPPKFWHAFAAAIGREEMIKDPKFRERADRIRNYELIHDELAPIFLTKPRAEWLQIFEDRDVPCTPIYTIDQVLSDPQVQHLGSEQVIQHSREGTIRVLGSPVHFTGTQLGPPAPPPTLGEHTNEILAELGYQTAQIEEFISEGAV